MRWSLRSLLVLLLVLALPVQGVLAATRALCVAHAAGGPQQPVQGAPDCHGHGGAPAEAAAGGTPVPAPAVDGAEPGDHAGCGACSACCAAAAMPAREAPVADTVAARQGFADVAVTVKPSAAAGPERPPRAA
jgi:hypothetical protein